MAKKKSIGIIIVFATLLLAVIMTNILMVFYHTRKETKNTGISRLESVSCTLEEMFAKAEKRTMQIAIKAEDLLLDREKLEAFILEEKQKLEAENNGAFNVYIAGKDWYIVPYFTNPEDFEPTDRIWYKGAVQSRGSSYITAPYKDVVTGKVCYSVSVMLGDMETVLAVDYTMDTIQPLIDSMYVTDSHIAVIATDEGIITGCSENELVGSKLQDVIPEYAGIWSLSKKDNGVATARIRKGLFYENLFAKKTVNSWYLIVSQSDWELYHDSYIQLFITVALALALFVLVLILYVFTVKSRKKTQDALYAKEEFIQSITGKLRNPLIHILNISKEEGETGATNGDSKSQMSLVHEEGEKLSEMIEQIISYSSIVRTEKKEKNQNRFEAGRLNKRYRSLIFLLMFLGMAFSLYSNIMVSYGWGNSRMRSKAAQYEYELSEWTNRQKSLLDMFVSVVSTNPDMIDDYEGMVRYLDRICQGYPDISVAYMANPEFEHTLIMNNGWEPDSDWKVEERQWYKDSLNSPQGWSISAPYMDVQTGGYCITISRCVYDADTSEFLGIFAIDFFIDKLVTILSDSYSDTGYAFMVDVDGNIVNHPYGSYQMTADSVKNVSELPYAEASAEDEETCFIKDYDGEYKALMSLENQENQFSVYVVSDIWPIYGRVFIYGVIALSIFLLCTILIYKLVTNMIIWQENVNKELKEAADAAMAAGNAKGRFLAQMSHEIRTPIN
nr:histidine kinase [Lachnospiraceae bacterium]